MADKDFTLLSLRGGLNDVDPAPALDPDACTLAENVEFLTSTLGERRLGCTAISLPTSITADANITAVTWMQRHLPVASEGLAELWVLGQNLAGSQFVLARRDQTTWSSVALALDTLNVAVPAGHQISAVSLHGKLFFAFDTDQDILHVWDGSTLRRVGMATPAAPTAVDTGVGGTFAGTRYYRIRYTVMSGSTVLRRSEPGAVLTFAPSGSKTGAVITKPVSIGESETHWEIEASTDNANFYRLSQIVVGTTTYTDTVALGTGYASIGNLSADIGDYTRIPSGKFVVGDDDRLIIGGSWENTDYASRIWWTPVYGDTTGVGNDERLELDSDPFLDLDGFSGGALTGISKSINGYIFAFKWSHIYKIVRKGQKAQAYEAFPMTKSKGALPGSIVEAFDESGNPSLFFLDPKTGPHRIGRNGLEWAGRDIQITWGTLNRDATIPCCGVYYPDKRQVHYWIATGSSNYPNTKIIVQTNEMRSSDEGARRGWSTVPSGNRISAAHCVTLFSSNVDGSTSRNQTLKPFIGKEQWTVNASTIKDLVQMCDTGQTDAFTAGDTLAAYTAKVRSKPFLTSGLLQKHGIQAASLLAKADPATSDTIYVKAIRDFGLDTLSVTTNLAPSASETDVIKELDNLTFSELKALQIEFGDTATPTNQWKLNGFAAKVRREETQ